MEFQKYSHLERLGTTEVEGIECGLAYVFPKIDGTNASVWLNEDGTVGAGSRNRSLSLESDNAGFYAWVQGQDNIKRFLKAYPDVILYGEWLVPHSLKTYRSEAWRRFYVFDVKQGDAFLPYDEYKLYMDAFGFDYLAPIRIIKNGRDEDFRKCVEQNVFLIEEGKGIGEGVVVKNYDWVNKFGRVTWAKVIANSFKEIHHKEMGAPITGGQSTEESIVDKYCSEHLIKKVYDKIVTEEGEWSSKFIPRLLNTVWYDLVREEIWDAIKHFKNPKIDFSFLQRLTIQKTKETLKEIF